MYSELAREKMWSRIHLIPLLQAEEDRDLVRRHYAERAREKALMGSETDVYNSGRYVFAQVEVYTTYNASMFSVAWLCRLVHWGRKGWGNRPEALVG